MLYEFRETLQRAYLKGFTEEDAFSCVLNDCILEHFFLILFFVSHNCPVTLVMK